MMKKLMLTVILLHVTSFAHAQDASLEARVLRLEQQQFSHQELPKHVITFGYTVPIDYLDVRQRIEREFYSILADRARLVLWQKRAAIYFPYIEEQLRVAEMPDDLKYVVIVESELQLNAYSVAGASGPWQFIKSTGRSYSLHQVGDSVDYRRDFVKSTAAAIKHMKDLYNIFHDWNLVLAAYNCGAGCVSSALRAQSVSSFWDLVLPSETERYVPRTIAIAQILKNAELYGVDVNYSAVEKKCVENTRVSIQQAVSVTSLAAMCNYLSYREVKLLNTWIKHNMLPRGEYNIVTSCGKCVNLRDRLIAEQRANRTHKVIRKKGKR